MRMFDKAKVTKYAVVSVFAGLAICAPARAQGYQWDASSLPNRSAYSVGRAIASNSTGVAGAIGRTTYNTGAGPMGFRNLVANPTTQQNSVSLPTTTMGLTPGASAGLPPTSLDSFVVQAGGNAELIYGDEGTVDIPPYFGFDQSHRINAGISGDNAGLTTNHGSMLPNAWGGDEFVMPEGPTMSGANNGNPYGIAGTYPGAGAANTAASSLSALSSTLPGSTWAQNHPRQTEVLTADSNIYNQINASYGSLGGNYNQLASQALAIQNQDVTEAAQNGGFITTGQQAQMDQENAALAQQVQYDHANSGF